MGRIALSVLLFQDILVVPILIVVGILARGGEGSAFAALGEALLFGFAVVAAILFFGRFILAPLLRSAAATGSRELVMAIALLCLLAAAVATSAAGLSLALGAFLAGLLLSESEYRHQIEVDLEPFKGLLLGLFFMTVGVSIDVVPLLATLPLVLISVVGLVALKGGVTYGVCRLFGTPRALSLEAALLLAGAGEFAFVVVGLAAAQGLVAAPVADFMIVVAGCSMLATPLIAPWAEAWARRWAAADTARRHAGEGLPADFRDHVIIGGFGRVGQLVARALDREAVPFIALDLGAETVARARGEGMPIFYGDASRLEILEKAGLTHARGVVVTLDAPLAAERMVRCVLEHHPDIPVLARTKDAAHARRLAALGPVGLVPEALEGSLHLAERLLIALGLPPETAARRIAQERDAEAERLGLGGEAAGPEMPLA